MYLGVDYYPEQWDNSLLEEDFKNIVELGSNTIRIGEFAWCRMEKTEGQFDFSLFDNVIQKAKENNLNVIFGTPTATLPAWLAKKHPDVLSSFDNGQQRAFGGRRNYCFNSENYKKYSNKIIYELVTHYKDEKSIVAWQIDNEFGHEDSDICYCDSCLNSFRDFLKDKYSDINKLNEIYGTIFWSQEYTTFDEIPLPMPTITTHNPSLRMDWELFRNISIKKFSDNQVKIIKEIIPSSTVFHDFSGGGMAKHYDMSDTAKNLDLVAYNNYPVWGGQKEPVPPHDIAFNLAYMRGLKQQNFWITEAIMGAQGHDITGYLPRPNQAKMWSYQAVAHGCSSLLYFRYRSATKGAEQFCYGILDADNVKRRKFNEVQSFFKDIEQYKHVLNSKIENEVCFITDYQSMASFRIQQQSILISYEAEMKKMYKPFHDKNVGVDVIPKSTDISKYKIVIIPLMIVWDNSFQKQIREFTNNGGIVVFTYRTAVKDEYNNVTFSKLLPTNLDDFIGGHIIETESLQEYDCITLKGESDFSDYGYQFKAGVFREFIETTTATTLFSYSDKFYTQIPAITKNTVGKGSVIYMGTSLVPESMDKFISYILTLANVKTIPSPDGIEVVERRDGAKKRTFIINHTDQAHLYNSIAIEPYGVVIV